MSNIHILQKVVEFPINTISCTNKSWTGDFANQFHTLVQRSHAVEALYAQCNQ